MPAARQHASFVSATHSTFLSFRWWTFPDSSPVQVRNTTPLSSTEHSSFTLTARLQYPRSPLLCARAMAVATSLWAASSFVPTSISHGLLQRLPLWAPAELLPSFAARKPRQRRKPARTLRHSLQRRKRNTQRSLPTRTRQPLTDISTTLSSRATHASASVVHLRQSLPAKKHGCMPM